MPVEDVLRFEREFLDYLRREQQGARRDPRDREVRGRRPSRRSTRRSTTFKPTFQTSEGSRSLGTEAEAEAMDDEDVEQEQIVKQKRG